MANKDLRKLKRSELIEIIYALQQKEQTLCEEKDTLQQQLNDKTIKLQNAGSIAEAALNMNHIFETADKAAKQYLDSVNSMAEFTVLNAQEKADGIIADAEKRKQQVEAECKALREETEKELKMKKSAFIKCAKRTLDKYPGLREHMSGEVTE